MKILLCQIDIRWESKTFNLNHFEKLLDDFFLKNNSGVDLIVFPEFFSTGFSFNKSLAEDMAGESVNWIKMISAKYNSAVLTSLPFIENNNYFNRAFYVYHDQVEFYDKRHLFSYGGEDGLFTSGVEQKVINCSGVRIFPQICYDLRFPVWSRNVDLKYDLLIYIANWPKSRTNVIEPLVRSRAIENLAFTIFVNRVGEDPQNLYCGSSMFVNYKGEVLENLENKEVFKLVEIDIVQQNNFRNNFRVWRDSDKFNLC